MEKYIPCKEQPKENVALLISGKIDFKTKTVIRHKQRYYLMIKRSIHPEDVTITDQ